MTLIFQEISDALQGTQSSKGVLKGFQRFSSHFGQFQVVHGRVFGTRQECFRKFHGVSGGLERFQMRFSGSYLLFFFFLTQCLHWDKTCFSAKFSIRTSTVINWHYVSGGYFDSYTVFVQSLSIAVGTGRLYVASLLLRLRQNEKHAILLLLLVIVGCFRRFHEVVQRCFNGPHGSQRFQRRLRCLLVGQPT